MLSGKKEILVEYTANKNTVLKSFNNKKTVYQEKLEDGRDRFARVNIHFTTENTLADFKNKEVMTTIDMDYFSNSGIDTTSYYRDNKNEEELNIAFSKTLQKMSEAGIKPTIHTTCLSDDDYLPSEDIPQATDFANSIISSTPQKNDIIHSYSRTHNLEYNYEKPYKGI